MKRDFLLEIGVEELPASFVKIGISGLFESFRDFLEKEHIEYEDLYKWASPRRLSIMIEGLSTLQTPKKKKIKGPPYKASFDEDGNPLPPAIGFAKKYGVDIRDLIIETEGKNKYIYIIKEEGGEKTEVLLAKYIPQIIRKLYFPKTMLWGEGGFKFARPIHWILAIFGEETINFEIAGIKASSYTFGHRFISPEKIYIEDPKEYVNRLKDAFVVVDRKERKKIIEQGYKDIARSLDANVEIPSYELLEEATDLVEYPTVMLGNFSRKYLKLPYEVPVSVMIDHQRYFPLYGKGGDLLPHFVFVSNSKRENEDIIVKGNERVIKARLEDALFYFTKDREISLEERIKDLKKVVFHKELGTLYDKVERIRDISKAIVELTRREDIKDTVDRVAYLCKADLITYMVREFPELEGVMGREYALLQGEPEEVAKGIYEHYLPKKAQDPIPKTWGGKIVSIADKLDTIFSYFSINLIPSGSFDPYGLRRKAQGIITILLKDEEIDISLYDLLSLTYGVMSKTGIVKIEHLSMVKEFFRERIRSMLEMCGIKYDIINAVIADSEIESVKAIFEKAKLFRDWYNTSSFKNVVIVFNRLNNILRKFKIEQDPQYQLFKENEEKILFDIWEEKKGLYKDAILHRQYKDAILIIEDMKKYIDDFFDRVLVMDKDEKIKENRLRLLNYILMDFKSLGDFSKIEGIV